MKNYIIRWWKGYIKLLVTGYSTEKFLNACRKKGCNFQGIRYLNSQELVLFTPISQQALIEELANKCDVKIAVQKQYGSKVLFSNILKYKSASLGILLCFFIVIFLSTRLWRIEIEGNSYYTRQFLEKQLNKLAICPGMDMNKIVCSTLERDLRKKLPNISWISVKKNGSYLLLQLEEGGDNGQNRNKAKADLIADTNGQIVSISVNKGQKRVHKGDYVKKGDVLITGEIPVIGDDQTPESYQYVHSSGNVLVQGKQKLIISKRRKQRLCKKLKNVKTAYKINIFGRELFFHNPLNQLEKDKKYAIISECDLINSVFLNNLPVSLECIQYRPIRYYSMTLSKSKLQEQCRKDFAKYLIKRERAGWQIKGIKKSTTFGKNSYKQIYHITYWKKQKKRKTISKGRELLHGDNGDSH